MSNFFINRPIFAWVIAIIIFFAGVVSIPNMAISQYPEVAPPTITVNATYPGAGAEEVARSVTSLIENELNGAEGMLYYASTSDSYGTAKIDVTFEPGTDPDLAQVDVQNRIAAVNSKLPQAVTQQGITYSKSTSGFLLIGTLSSTDGSLDDAGLGDYITRNIQNSIARIKGVGQFQLFASPRAMRIWVDSAKMTSFGLTTSDIKSALQTQNAQITGGTLGSPPTPDDQTTSATVIVNGQLSTVKEFGDIVLRATTGGSTVRLSDVARIEVGADSYQFGARLNGQTSAAFAVSLAPNANALETSKLVQAEMESLSKYFPDNIEYKIPYNTAPYVDASITQVVHTLVEAMLLVFVVMFLFLQNIRYTLIPAIVVPVALMGTLATLSAMGYSINTLTMFAMVLAIGILVDDAIVVVENVERIMAEEGLQPKEATVKAMPQIFGAIVGITLVLMVVFAPLFFMGGSAGVIYRQFAAAMIISIGFSAFLALTFTPAMCATLLKPVPKGHHEKKGFFGWFNRTFTKITNNYTGFVGRLLKRGGRMMLIYLGLVILLGFLYLRLPSSFLPTEDQGYAVTNIELPAGVSAKRTEEVIKQVEEYYKKQPEVENIITVQGFSFNGSGLNSAIAFTPFKKFADRKGEEHNAMSVAGRATGQLLFGIPDAMVLSIVPPSIPSLGTATGFDLRLQDRGGMGQTQLREAANQLIQLSGKSKILSQVRISGLGPGPQLKVTVDRIKAYSLGVNMAEVGSVLSGTIGNSYLGQFPNQGWMQNVWIQAEADQRMSPEDILKLRVHNTNGDLVPLSSFVTLDWVQGQSQVQRYNSYDSITIQGQANAGYANGEAMDEIVKLVGQLPSGIGYEWTGLSYQEVQAGSQASIMLALAFAVVFLVLAALYESWWIPLSAVLVVPLGMLGTVGLVSLVGMSNDIYFQVGMITVIGLSAKNAILIVEFAKDAFASGKGLVESTLEAAKLRFRPILMTSFAFIMGVIPLMLANAEGAASQQAVGYGVFGGMLAATPFAVLFVPTFFVVVMTFFKVKPRLLGRQADEHEKATEAEKESQHIYTDVAEADDMTAGGDSKRQDGSPPKGNE